MVRSASLLLILTFLTAARCAGQNLVPNGNFELYNACPNGLSGPLSVTGIAYSPTYSLFPSVQGWVMPLDLATPDYFNTCSPSTLYQANGVGVPNNFFGYQPARSGNGYIGMYTYLDASALGTQPLNYREFASCKLTQPLVAGKKYCVSYFVSPVSRSSSTYDYVGVDELGAAFTRLQPSSATATTLALTPNVRPAPGSFITDTSAWTEVKGVFTASGGEEWMTLGVFNNTPVPGYMVIPPATARPGKGLFSYAYIDDVSVSPFVEHISTHDTTICNRSNISRTIASQQANATWLWNTGETTQQINISSTGTYWCVATTTGCEAYIDTFRVIYTPIDPPVLHDTVLCQYTAPPALSTGSDVRWYSSAADTTGSPTQPAIDMTRTGTVTLYAGRVNGNCKSSRVPVKISILAAPVAALGPDRKLCADAQDSLQLGTDQYPASYAWNTGSTACCITTNQPGTYILTVTNPCGAATDTMDISTYRCNDCVFIPNGFTPNKDGKNDVFRPRFICPVEHYKMAVYNRWGQKLFTTVNAETGWDGSQFGRDADAGTYMYLITYEHAITGRHFEAKGDITLVR